MKVSWSLWWKLMKVPPVSCGPGPVVRVYRRFERRFIQRFPGEFMVL